MKLVASRIFFYISNCSGSLCPLLSLVEWNVHPLYEIIDEFLLDWLFVIRLPSWTACASLGFFILFFCAQLNFQDLSAFCHTMALDMDGYMDFHTKGPWWHDQNGLMLKN
jgi:hypothetical protein